MFNGNEIEIQSCPNEYIGADIRKLAKCADLVKSGVPLTSGGYFELPASLTRAMECFWSHEDALKREVFDE